MLEEFGEGILAQHQCIEAVNSHWIQGWLSDVYWARAQGWFSLRNQEMELGWQCLQIDLQLFLLLLPMKYPPHLSHLSDLKLFSEPLLNGEVGGLKFLVQHAAVDRYHFLHYARHPNGSGGPVTAFHCGWDPQNSAKFFWFLLRLLSSQKVGQVEQNPCMWDPSSNAISWVFIFTVHTFQVLQH